MRPESPDQEHRSADRHVQESHRIALVDIHGRIHAPPGLEAIGLQTLRWVVQAAGPDPVRHQRDRLRRFHCVVLPCVRHHPTTVAVRLRSRRQARIARPDAWQAARALYAVHAASCSGVIGSVDFGFDIGMGVEKLCEQQTHLPAVHPVELDPSRVHGLRHLRLLSTGWFIPEVHHSMPAGAPHQLMA